MIKVLVCGGREFDDFRLLAETLDKHTDSSTLIIHGNAIGADFLARVYAKYCHMGEKRFPADWKKYGKAAGHIRNQQMLDEGKPDLVIAFPGGDGTADMVRRARKAGVEVIEVD
jgi:UDP-N-acetylmuramoylalanine-D-glutamate ligase